MVPWGFLGSSELPFPLRFPSSSPPQLSPPIWEMGDPWSVPGVGVLVGGGGGGPQVCPFNGVLGVGGCPGLSLQWGPGGVLRYIPALGVWGCPQVSSCNGALGGEGGVLRSTPAFGVWSRGGS